MHSSRPQCYFDPNSRFDLLSQALTLPNPLAQFTSIPPLTRQTQIPSLSVLTQQNLLQNNNHPPYDLTIDPTKRIRHSQCDFTETKPRILEIPKTSEVGLIKQNMNNFNQKQIPRSFELGNAELIIPDVKGLNRFGLARLEVQNNMDYPIYRHFARLIEQQNAEKFLQYQLLQQAMLKQHHMEQLDQLTQHHLMQQAQHKLDMSHLSQDISLTARQLTRSNSDDSTKSVDKLVKNYNGQVKIEEMEASTNEKLSGESQQSQEEFYQECPLTVRKKEEKKIFMAKKVQKEIKKRKNQNYSSDCLGLAHTMKEGPRRKNKWQSLGENHHTEVPNTEQNLLLPQGEDQAIEKVEEQKVDETNFAPLVKIIPLIDENNVDYAFLQTIKITNDPVSLGYENPSQEFTVIMGKTEEPSGDEEKEIRVGSKYQATIPVLNTGACKPRPKKKCLNLVWNPKVMDENEVKKYLNDLCVILNSERINEERALKLLKRKNYKKQRVKVNISKNEKFYSSFLTVIDNPLIR